MLVAGGKTGGFTLSSSELFDPATGKWTKTGSLNFARYFHTATLLLNGQLLVAGGYGGNVLSSAELYDVGLGFNSFWQPQIAMATLPLSLGGSLTLSGSQFRGISGASSGNSQDSAADYPVVQMRSLESGQTFPCIVAKADSVTRLEPDVEGCRTSRY
jgi:hypothetical protein